MLAQSLLLRLLRVLLGVSFLLVELRTLCFLLSFESRPDLLGQLAQWPVFLSADQALLLGLLLFL